MIKYRGFSIHQDENTHEFVITEKAREVARAVNVAMALDWIDTRKKLSREIIVDNR